jgi:hypothetical protein
MLKRVFLAFALAMAAILAFADDAGGLIEGEGWAFLVSAPTGWVWDSHSLRAQGIEGLFYKEGAQFVPTALHIYIYPTQKIDGGPANLAEFEQADENAFMASSSGVLVKNLSIYSSSVGYNFAMRDLDDQNEDYYQAIAYYEGDEAFFIFVLSCRSPEERERERGAFFELLDSFTYLRKE